MRFALLFHFPSLSGSVYPGPMVLGPSCVVFTPQSILPESSIEIITLGATKADFDVGRGGSCTKFIDQVAVGVIIAPMAMASSFF